MKITDFNGDEKKLSTFTNNPLNPYWTTIHLI
jgi:hypothetical protein